MYKLQGSGICSAELAGIPATGANVLVLGLNSGVVNFRLVAPGFPDQGSVMERFNEGHKSNSRVRAVLAGTNTCNRRVECVVAHVLGACFCACFCGYGCVYVCVYASSRDSQWRVCVYRCQ